MNITSYKDEIFHAHPISFPELALWAFRYQYEHTMIYRRYVDLRGIDPDGVKTIEDIPFLPISLFKTQTVIDSTYDEKELKHFESSTTTGLIPSKHWIADPGLYERSFRTAFTHFFGKPTDYCIIGLLPSYLERGNSSLVYMVNRLIEDSNHLLSGFYLHNFDALIETIQTLEKQEQKTLLFGVTFALLDLADQVEIPLKHVRLMETGGMKGRREEWTRNMVHARLKEKFHLPLIYSEYGMTELLSQAYSINDELFQSPSWMKICIRDLYDPLTILHEGRGGVNIIDLANIHSCCFIATDDLGEIYPDQTFKIHGRIDQSELRGCSLLTI